MTDDASTPGETAARTPPAPPAPTAHDWRPDRFMVIVAHPDDADFGPAATAASWIDQGSQGWLVCCTSGDAGGEDADLDPLVLSATREAEQRAAATVVGYEGVQLPPPAGRSTCQRPGPARVARARDPDVPARRDLLQRPGDAVLGGRRGQPHRPSDTLGSGDRRGLSGRPQPDGVPVARPRGPGRPPGPASVSVLDREAERMDSNISATRRAQSTRCAPTRARSRSPTSWALSCARGPREAGAKIGVAAAESFRLIVLDEDESSADAGDQRRPMPKRRSRAPGSG